MCTLVAVAADPNHMEHQIITEVGLERQRIAEVAFAIIASILELVEVLEHHLLHCTMDDQQRHQPQVEDNQIMDPMATSSSTKEKLVQCPLVVHPEKVCDIHNYNRFLTFCFS